MSLNLYLYQQNAASQQLAYEFLKKNLALIGRKITIFSSYEFLPPSKSDHPGDFSLIKTKKVDFENDMDSKIIDSFALSNRTDLSKSDAFVCYFVSEKYVNPSSTSIHIQDDDYDESSKNLINKIFDEYVKLTSPSYGFQCPSKTIYKGVAYLLTGSLFNNERANFISYISESKNFDRMRMVYSVNYLTKMQLERKVRDVKLIDLINKNGKLMSIDCFSDSLYKVSCRPEDLNEINEIFGEMGFLASWYRSR